MKKLAVLTSGGDAPGMNAAIRAVVRTAIYHEMAVLGVVRGYQGLIDDDIIPLEAKDVANIIQRGGTILKSARCQEFMSAEGRRKAYDNLKKHGVDSLVVIGGDGTFAGANVFLNEYPDLKIVGLAGTIDNDLYGTDFTIGYDTALNTVTEAVDKIRDTAASHDRLFIVEVMGKDAGFIALRAGIGSGAESILVPETEFFSEHLIEHLKSGKKRKKDYSIVLVAEGNKAGGAFEMAELVKKECPDFDTRVLVLGHIQRGGSPSCMERVRASQMGNAAVEALMDGISSAMIGIVDKEIRYTPFDQAVKHHDKINNHLLELAHVLSL